MKTPLIMTGLEAGEKGSQEGEKACRSWKSQENSFTKNPKKDTIIPPISDFILGTHTLSLTKIICEITHS